MGKKSDKEILSLVPTFILGKSESVNFLDETAGTIFCVDLSFESFGQRFALDEKSLGGKKSPLCDATFALVTLRYFYF